ncbi:hypothetical protein GJ698_26220 [Pseudoduganella sp. FT26W]|uniref:Nucleotidyltransferase n=1 Tax=Duganella aquatilis TaxID=2666082 RepID=A0A844D3Z9_9BURK|nr:nucleotidyltransferase substrate binding protein [Duganella aquatilis]MRW87573.1 hypothetical protein [Duganella aquatilis]
MSEQDIRWLQRLSNYRRALAQLKKFIDKGELNELEQQGWIKAFEFTHELAWNKETADAIGALVVERYFTLFVALEAKMGELSHGV